MKRLFKKHSLFPAFVAGVLIFLAALYLNAEILKRDRERTLVMYDGATDEISVIAVNEVAQFKHVNERQQVGILIVGAVILVVASGGWVVQTVRRDRE